MLRPMLADFIARAPLGYKLKKSLLKRLAPDVIKGRDFTRPFYGLTYFGYTGNIIDLQVFLRGAYEKYLLHFMRDYLTHHHAVGQAVALDIGANVGHHTLFLSTICSVVHSFEPYPPVLKQLHDQVKRNHLNHVTIHPYGLSDLDQTLPFYAPPMGNSGMGSFVSHHHDAARTDGRLTLRRGDDVVKELGLSRLDLIKIDVEGFEPNVLKGLTGTLARYRPLVLFELGATALAQFGQGTELRIFFPPDYVLYTFSRVDSNQGTYVWSSYQSGQTYPTEMVVAAPAPLANPPMIP